MADMENLVKNLKERGYIVRHFETGLEAVSYLNHTLDQKTIGIGGSTVEGGITAQAEQSMKNLLAFIEQAGVNPSNIVKTTCFLADIGDFAAFNEVYQKYIPSAPARSCVAVKEMPRSVLCEVEDVVYLKK